MYRRVAALTQSDDASFQDLLDELTERYGLPPDELANLFTVVAIKKELIPLRINRLERSPNSLVFSFLPDTPVDSGHFAHYLQQAGSSSRLTPDGRLVVKTKAQSMQEIRTAVKDTVANLQQLSHERTIHKRTDNADLPLA